MTEISEQFGLLSFDLSVEYLNEVFCFIDHNCPRTWKAGFEGEQKMAWLLEERRMEPWWSMLLTGRGLGVGQNYAVQTQAGPRNSCSNVRLFCLVGPDTFNYP